MIEGYPIAALLKVPVMNVHRQSLHEPRTKHLSNHPFIKYCLSWAPHRPWFLSILSFLMDFRDLGTDSTL